MKEIDITKEPYLRLKFKDKRFDLFVVGEELRIRKVGDIMSDKLVIYPEAANSITII